MFKRKKDGGFTLIELMIVISVIGILAVVLVPKMSGVKTSAKVTGVQTNVKSVQAYVTANISNWANSSKTEVQIKDLLLENFSGDNAIKNPLSTKDNMSFKFDSGAITSSPAPDEDDALQIRDDVASTPPKGGVIVKINSNYAVTGIDVIGFDDQGKEVAGGGTVKY